MDLPAKRESNFQLLEKSKSKKEVRFREEFLEVCMQTIQIIFLDSIYSIFVGVCLLAKLKISLADLFVICLFLSCSH
jgi:hypothetical protein